MDRGAWWAAVRGHEESDMTEQLHFHFSLSCIGEGNGKPTPVFLSGESQGRGSQGAAVYGVAQSWTQDGSLSCGDSPRNDWLTEAQL